MAPDLDKMVHVKHILVRGVVKKPLMKFLWPAQPLSKTFWDAVADGMLGMYVCMYACMYVCTHVCIHTSN